MITSKQRAYLRSMSNKLEPVFHIGKGGVTPEFIDEISKVLEARELIKINILDNCMLETRQAATLVAERTRSDVVQVIGNRFIIYKPAKKPVIELPKVKKG